MNIPIKPSIPTVSLPVKPSLPKMPSVPALPTPPASSSGMLDKYTEKINNATSCEDLNKIEAEVTQYFNTMLASLKVALGKLAPVVQLPGNPMDILGWAGNVVNALGLPGYIKTIELQAQLPVQFAGMLSSITAKMNSLSCDIPAAPTPLTLSTTPAISSLPKY